MKEIDARGHACPEPVLMTKRAVEAGASEISVLVDNEASADNVVRFAKKAGFSAETAKRRDDFKVSLKKTEDKQIGDVEVVCDAAASKMIKDKVLLISSDSLGRDDRDLGTLLVKVLLNALAENEALPEKIVFMNAGVKLCCEGSESLDALNQLAGQGVELLACGTCLKHFEISEKLQVGRVSNAYEIMNVLLKGNVLPWA
ncbi:MAG: sulfurtransferase-like selenium metabolism protein YedF [bacterium]